MSTLPPIRQQDSMRTTIVNMAVAQSKQAKATPTKVKDANSKSKSQMHRRSRTGCYTCRLRRKKCDEGTPVCSACKHLGLQCEFKRPMWWGNNDARRNHKDEIKIIIKRKKISEKSHHNTIRTSVSSASSPPQLSHSLPTSATFSDGLDRTRSASIDSHFSTFNFNSPPSVGDYTTPLNGQLHSDFMFGGAYPPYEIDVKTERQMFVNDVPTLRESTTSTFSTFQPPPPGSILPSFPAEGGEWTEQVYQERRESLTEEGLNTNFFDFAHGPMTESRQVDVDVEVVDPADQRLLDHFVSAVLPTIFPILESNQHGSVSSDLILPSLQSNKGYLHCCLSIAAQHLKATMNLAGDEMDSDIMRHRYATITYLCQELNRDENHQQILEATLGMIFFQCCVGRPEDVLPDIAWHQHFQAAVSLVQKLDLPRLVSESPEGAAQSPFFNMTLTAWIDILGATMQGRSPQFAHTYREKLLSQTNSSIGLRELMGCDDRVMYLVSEIGCLEALKRDGMDDMQLCSHVHALGEQLTLTEIGETAPRLPFNANRTLSPKQLSKNITAAFRIAARIYLCSLVPGFSPAQDSCVGLVEKLTNVLQNVPSGTGGFDRSLAWVYLVGGAVSEPGSSFRDFLESRVIELGDLADLGSFGRVACLLREVWTQTDLARQRAAANPAAATAAAAGDGAIPQTPQEATYVHWRDVMQSKGWDYLLI